MSTKPRTDTLKWIWIISLYPHQPFPQTGIAQHRERSSGPMTSTKGEVRVNHKPSFPAFQYASQEASIKCWRNQHSSDYWNSLEQRKMGRHPPTASTDLQGWKQYRIETSPSGKKMSGTWLQCPMTPMSLAFQHTIQGVSACLDLHWALKELT